MKFHDGLQLEAAYLRHHHVLIVAFQPGRGIGIANVPHHMRHFAGIFEHFSQQADGGGFAVGARHRHGDPPGKLKGHLQLANHLQPHLPGFDYKGRRIGDAGADDHAFGLIQQLHGRAAKAPLARQAPQLVQRLAKGGLLLGIVQDGRCPCLAQEFCHGNAAASHAHHQNPLTGNLHFETPPWKTRPGHFASPGVKHQLFNIASVRSGTAPPQRTKFPSPPRTWRQSAFRCIHTAQSDDEWGTF